MIARGFAVHLRIVAAIEDHGDANARAATWVEVMDLMAAKMNQVSRI